MSPAGRVTVMGLGLHGGGLASALHFARRGWDVTITDLKSEEELAPSLPALAGYDVRLVLGRHREEDFTNADVIIKNPGVRNTSKYLQVAREARVAIETDISVFLAHFKGPLLAVTGTKGKSTTVSAMHAVLREWDPRTRLGGNITVSPLTFLEELEPEAPVVLELSSWQLGDLRGRSELKPRVSLVTNILPDHLNTYPSMEAYIDDKRVICASQGENDYAVLNADDPTHVTFRTQAQVRRFGVSPESGADAWLEADGQGFLKTEDAVEQILPRELTVPGIHNRINLLAAGLALRLYGVPSGFVAPRLAAFAGVEHRLEPCADHGPVRFYNDSAATIPEATVQALEALAAEGPVVLICGGTDKVLDFTPLADSAHRAASIHLLAGSGTNKLIPMLKERSVVFNGPYDSLTQVVQDASTVARALAARPGGSRVSVLFSPGATSFEMFRNEFDRGRRFKELVGSS